MKTLWTLTAIAAIAAFAIGANAQKADRPSNSGTMKGGPVLKMRIAVAEMDWTDKDMIDSWRMPVAFQNAIHEKLIKRLMDTGKFVVLEREAMQALQIEKAIKEENSGQSQKGKIVPAQALVRAKMTNFELAKRGGGGGISIGPVSVGGSQSVAEVGMNVRIFNVDTSELLASEEAKGSAKATGFSVGASFGSVGTNFGAFEKSPLGQATDKALEDAVKKIVAKLEGQPWSALVADWDATAKEATLNAGTDLGVAEGMEFDVYRTTRVIKDPETGEVLGKRVQKIGRVKVVSVEKKLSFAERIEGDSFEAGDIVRVPK